MKEKIYHFTRIVIASLFMATIVVSTIWLFGYIGKFLIEFIRGVV